MQIDVCATGFKRLDKPVEVALDEDLWLYHKLGAGFSSLQYADGLARICGSCASQESDGGRQR